MADNQPFGNELLLSLAKNPELMSILGSIPKGIFSWLGSRGIRKETKKQMTADRASLEGMISKQIFDPYMVAGLEKTQTYQEAAQAGNRLDAGYNLDIGSGLGGIMENTLGERQSRLGAVHHPQHLQQPRLFPQRLEGTAPVPPVEDLLRRHGGTVVQDLAHQLQVLLLGYGRGAAKGRAHLAHQCRVWLRPPPP